MLTSGANTHKLYINMLWRRWKAFHLRENLFKILKHIKNLYNGGGMTLRVRQGVKT